MDNASRICLKVFLSSTLWFPSTLNMLRAPLKYLVKRYLKGVGYAERGLKGGRIFSCFNGCDCLPCDAYALPELGLRHFTFEETKSPDSIGDRALNHPWLLSHACLR